MNNSLSKTLAIPYYQTAFDIPSYFYLSWNEKNRKKENLKLSELFSFPNFWNWSDLNFKKYKGLLSYI